MSFMTTKQPLFDYKKLTLQRNRSANLLLSKADKNFNFLHQHVENKLFERLHDINRTFNNIAIIGVFGTELSKKLNQYNNKANIVYLDIASQRLKPYKDLDKHCCLFDGSSLPLRHRAFDLVLSSMLLHWVEDLPGLMVQIYNILQPDGLFLASCLGNETLTELTQSLIVGESKVTRGSHARTIPLPELRSITDLLTRAHFSLPVGDSETLNITWPNLYAIMHDLRAMGECNALQARPRHFTSSKIFAFAEEHYIKNFMHKDGSLQASFNILYLHGWAPSPNQPKPLKPGSGQTSLFEHFKDTTI